MNYEGLRLSVEAADTDAETADAETGGADLIQMSAQYQRADTEHQADGCKI